ncbi:hypothetical protein FRB93_010053 [Tulasnella sp. JGI-2019a]|nr:hypothetical protein FRB93_010053 [Tulasnella sp. JGI-2019a]
MEAFLYTPPVDSLLPECRFTSKDHIHYLDTNVTALPVPPRPQPPFPVSLRYPPRTLSTFKGRAPVSSSPSTADQETVPLGCTSMRTQSTTSAMVTARSFL